MSEAPTPPNTDMPPPIMTIACGIAGLAAQWRGTANLATIQGEEEIAQYILSLHRHLLALLPDLFRVFKRGDMDLEQDWKLRFCRIVSMYYDVSLWASGKSVRRCFDQCKWDSDVGFTDPNCHVHDRDDDPEYAQCKAQWWLLNGNLEGGQRQSGYLGGSRVSPISPELGRDVWDLPAYSAWETGHSNVLWCLGKPGSGKSVLSAMLAERLDKESGFRSGVTGNSPAVIDYFFDRKDTSSAHRAVANLLRQLLVKLSHAPLPKFWTRRFHQSQDWINKDNEAFSVSEMVLDFLSMCSKSSHPVYIVLDGVELCSDLENLLEALVPLVESHHCRMWLSCKTEFYARAPKALRHGSNIIQLEEHNYRDMIRFMEHCCSDEVQQLTLWFRIDELLPKGERDALFHQFVRAAEGSYTSLLLKSNFDSVLIPLSTEGTEFELEVKKLVPLSLDATYELLVQRLAIMDGKFWQAAISPALMWFAYSRRLLSPFEIRGTGLELRDHDRFYEANRAPRVSASEKLLVGYEVFDELFHGEFGDMIWKYSPSMISDMHRLRHRLFPQGEDYIARCILSLLRHDFFCPGAVRSAEEYRRRLQWPALSGYIYQNWGYHVKSLSGPKKAMLYKLLEQPDGSILEGLSQMLHVTSVDGIDFDDYPRDFGLLHFAVYFGMYDLAEHVITKRPQAENWCDSWGRTPLHIFSQVSDVIHRALPGDAGHTERTDLATLTALDSPKDTPMAMFELLIRRTNIPWHSIDKKHGRTPLHYLAVRNLTDLPICYTASDINTQDNYGKTPLDYATENGNLNLVKRLIVPIKTRRTSTAFLAAVSRGLIEIVDFLLPFAAESDADSLSQGLLEAARNGHLRIVRLILARTLDHTVDNKVAVLDYMDEDGMTALHHASISGHKAVMEYLMSKGVNLNAVDNLGRSALMRACEAGHLELVKILLMAHRSDIKSEINKRDRSGRTAFDLAAENGDAKVLEYLLLHGADPQMVITPNDGEPDRISPLQVACTIGYEDATAILLRQPYLTARPDQLLASGTSPLICACRNGHEGIIDQMFEYWGEIDVNVADDTGRTPLSHAAGNGWCRVVKFLLDKEGIDCDIKDQHGRGAVAMRLRRGVSRLFSFCCPVLSRGL
ncbi:ankyrin repeat-containing domain protein [Rhypophila decipiens]|uniref:Ankyrin repeat-containing domain protein n=1 Tax=Rhypophila decipiens TaxID=261697 RepID=A0AAN7B3W3_9PEZI|nr:ankyrin repeat-containing domain protein [Rhypophila decipiens]